MKKGSRGTRTWDREMASEMAAVSTLKSDGKCKWGIPNKRQKLTEDRMKTWDQAKRLEEEDTKKLKLKG